MVSIAIYYNGKFPRHHTVTRAFYERLLAFQASHPRFDVEIVVLDDDGKG